LSVERGDLMSGTEVACANSIGGTVSASKGDPEGMVLSRSRSSLHWASAVRGSLLMLLAGLSSSSTCVGSSSVSKRFPPGSYTNLPKSLVPKSLALRGWLLRLQSLLLPSSMTPMSSRVGLPWMLSGLWLSLGTRAGSGFVIGLASLFLTLAVSACSFAWWLWLIGLTSVASDCLGDAAAIDEGGGGVCS